MEKESLNPLAYFENLIEDNKIVYLKNKMIDDFLEMDAFWKLEHIDREEGIVEFIMVHYDTETRQSYKDKSTLNFHNNFQQTLNAELKKAEQYIDRLVVQATINGNNPSEIINLQQKLIKKLIDKAKEIYPSYPSVEETLKGLHNYLKTKYTEKSSNPSSRSLILENPDEYSPDSFCWDAFDDEQRIESLKKLYELLGQNPKVIEGSLEEFINAFSQKAVINGIKWHICGKSGKMAKTSLLYFIRTMAEEGFINPIADNTELYRKIRYVFRNPDGTKIEGLRKSNYTSSHRPTGKKQIDKILNSLF
ncbi:hypothetical protein [Mesonia sp. K7]|uniref:hypothetical protein n=1 Tax=Mesonia sp. K7 TaxID=2218606 RepID=UPI000DA7C187|nr:hypothetical protein [Mesonia sp. K7]PZD77461.1 hypothetical protein DNG35_09100 [Mesonia sp. K7]